MLDRHPQLAVAPEGFFIMNLRRRFARGPWSHRRVEAFCRDLLLENRMRTWQLDIQDVRARLLARLNSSQGLDFRSACEAVYTSYAECTAGCSDVVCVGDKNPHYGLFADRLVRLFPGARFIHIVRDARDNVLSYKQVPFDLDDTAALAYRWARYNHELMEVAARHPASFLRIHYERLIADPEPTLSEVCAFLGVDFEPSMLSFFERAPQGFYGEGSAWFDKLGKPLDASQARKWASDMLPSEVRLVEAVAGEALHALGYERSSMRPGLSPIERARAGVGWGSVAAEKAIFGIVPARWRIWFINTYRSRTGRV